MTKARKWLRVQMAADDPTRADLFILGIIGDWVDDLWEDIGLGFDSITTAKSFKEELDALPDSVKTLRLRVNSPGGDVSGAVAIANMLRDWGKADGRSVESSVEGLAASAASLVIQAGETVRIADNGLVMLHHPWTRAAGNARELREAAGELDTLTRSSIVPTYQWHSELSEDEILRLMDATTWMGADEAIENGFATEKVEGLKAAACIEPRMVAKLNVPEKYRSFVDALVAKTEPKDTPKDDMKNPPAEPAPTTTAAAATEVLRLCREAECLDVAEELIAASASLEDVTSRVASERESKEKAEARAAEIRGLCESANLPELAASYISGHMPADIVRNQLTMMTARLDNVELDGSLHPDQGARAKPRLHVSEIYAERNRLQLTAGKKESI